MQNLVGRPPNVEETKRSRASLYHVCESAWMTTNNAPTRPRRNRDTPSFSAFFHVMTQAEGRGRLQQTAAMEKANQQSRGARSSQRTKSSQLNRISHRTKTVTRFGAMSTSEMPNQRGSASGQSLPMGLKLN